MRKLVVTLIGHTVHYFVEWIYCRSKMCNEWKKVP